MLKSLRDYWSAGIVQPPEIPDCRNNPVLVDPIYKTHIDIDSSGPETVATYRIVGGTYQDFLQFTKSMCVNEMRDVTVIVRGPSVPCSGFMPSIK